MTLLDVDQLDFPMFYDPRMWCLQKQNLISSPKVFILQFNICSDQWSMYEPCFIWFLNFLHLHIHVHVQRIASSKLRSLTIAWMGFRMYTILAYWIFLDNEIWEVVNQKKNGNSLQHLWWERHGPCPCSQTWLKEHFEHLKQLVSSVDP